MIIKKKKKKKNIGVYNEELELTLEDDMFESNSCSTFLGDLNFDEVPLQTCFKTHK